MLTVQEVDMLPVRLSPDILCHPGRQHLLTMCSSLLEHKTKPVGSLGVLERLAHRISFAYILGQDAPVLQHPQIVMFAADQAWQRAGVSAYPIDVTWQMVENFMAGGAAVSVLSRQHQGIHLNIVDCGVAPTSVERRKRPRRQAAQGWQPRFVAPQSGLWHARQLGRAQAMSEPNVPGHPNRMELVKNCSGNELLLGEMGIGNTSTHRLLLAGLCQYADVSRSCGMGTGLDAEGVRRKMDVLRECSPLPGVSEPLAVLVAMGGLEVATHGGRCARLQLSAA